MGRGIRRIVRATAFIMAALVVVSAPALCFGQAARETWQPPEKILDAIGVKSGMRVGEAGAGQGYFTFPLARRVGPRGAVFANDISTSSLDVIRERAGREGLANIKTVMGAVEDPLFPEKNLDMIVMVYVLHMLERPIPFVKNLRSYLKPGGVLVIIERNTTIDRAHSPSFMTNRQILETLTGTGYALDRTETFLPRDTIYIYKTSTPSGVPAGETHGATADGAAVSVGVYRRIQSAVLGEERTMLIRVPADYGEGQKRYPVLYKLDGGKSVFLQTVGTVEYLADWEQAPDYIVVGIENTDRDRDMLPERGADQFIRFLAEELVPFVEVNYRTNESRVLAGQSSSSGFALYACLREPELFDGYVLSSLGMSEARLPRFETALNQRSQSLRKHHWVYVGNARVDSYDKDGSRARRGLAFLESLKKAEGPALDLECRVFDDQGHVPFPTLHYALRWMAERLHHLT
jgi:predicted alpha/beta superfamily hydrolase/predicted methyltransferase